METIQRISIGIRQSRCVILTRESLSRKSPVYINSYSIALIFVAARFYFGMFIWRFAVPPSAAAGGGGGVVVAACRSFFFLFTAHFSIAI